MNDLMKILIAYDGSECADEAIDDLSRAGLPSEGEAVVLTIADVWEWGVETEEAQASPASGLDIIGLKRAREETKRAKDEARSLAERACERLRMRFPAWQVRAESSADSPARGVVKMADEWKPDLILMGSHGRSALGRMVLGNVSQRVLYEARCPVRIGRRSGSGEDANAPVRLIVATDGSTDASAAVEEVARRRWARGSQAWVVGVLDTVMSFETDKARQSIVRWIDSSREEDVAWAHESLEVSAAKLRAAGLVASVVIKKGSPKRAILEAAEEWSADCVFLGARGLRGVERLLLGSVSAAISAHASCSVEVVRPRE